MNDFSPDAIVSHPAVPGIVGALVGLKFAPGASWSERAINFTSASAIAWFGSPAAVELFSIKSPGAAGFLGFAIGMFGLSIAAAVVSGIKDLKLGEIAAGWLSRRG